jgi:hypothetical protein
MQIALKCHKSNFDHPSYKRIMTSRYSTSWRVDHMLGSYPTEEVTKFKIVNGQFLVYSTLTSTLPGNWDSLDPNWHDFEVVCQHLDVFEILDDADESVSIIGSPRNSAPFRGSCDRCQTDW